MKFTALPVEFWEDITLDLEQLQALLTIPAWTAPTLVNSWVNLGAPYETAGYLKDALGFVHLKGGVSTGTSGTTVFTLPVGFRPGATGFYSTVTSGFTAPGALLISTAGLVQSFGTNASANTFLSGITFLAEN